MAELAETRSAPVAGEAHRSADAAHAARSGVLQVLAALGQALMPAYQAMVAQLFGQAVHGLYFASMAAIEIASRAGVAGADKGMLRFVAAHRLEGRTDRVAAALAAGLRLSGAMGLLLALGLGLGAGLVVRFMDAPDATGPLRFLAPTVLRILAPTVLPYVWMLVLVAATLGARVSRVHLAVRGIGEPVLLIVGALCAWAAGTGVRGLALAHTLAYVGLLGLALLGARRVLGGDLLARAARGPAQPGFSGFAVPLGMAELTNAVLQKADVLILAAFTGPKTVTLYAAAETLTRSVAGLRYAFDGIAAPLLSESLHQRDRQRLRYNLALLTRWVALAAAPIGAIVITLRPELLRLFGRGYQDAATAMALLALAHMVNGIIGLAPHVLLMSGRTRLFFWINFGAAITSVTLNLILVPRLGIVGAATSALVSVSVLQAALAIAVWRLERVHAFSLALLKPLVAAGAVLAFGLLVRGYLPSAGARIAGVIVGGTLIYLAVLLALGPAEEERQLWRKLRARLGVSGRGPRV